MWTKEKADYYFPRNKATVEKLEQLNAIIVEYNKNFDLMLKQHGKAKLLQREKELHTQEIKLRQRLCMFVPGGR